MRNRLLSTSVAVLGLAALIACSGPASITSPSAAASSRLATSVEAVVVGHGTGSISSPGISMSVWAGEPVTASAKLEIGFDDGSPSLDVPFEPQSVRIERNARAMLTTSVPEASDPRLGGRKPSSYRAAITVRDDTGAERIVFVPFSIPR
jgi:hypothetical protein